MTLKDPNNNSERSYTDTESSYWYWNILNNDTE